MEVPPDRYSQSLGLRLLFKPKIGKKCVWNRWLQLLFGKYGTLKNVAIQSFFLEIPVSKRSIYYKNYFFGLSKPIAHTPIWFKRRIRKVCWRITQRFIVCSSDFVEPPRVNIISAWGIFACILQTMYIKIYFLIKISVILGWTNYLVSLTTCQHSYISFTALILELHGSFCN